MCAPVGWAGGAADGGGEAAAARPSAEVPDHAHGERLALFHFILGRIHPILQIVMVQNS